MEEEEKDAKGKISPSLRDPICLYGTSSSSENEQKKLSPDGRGRAAVEDGPEKAGKPPTKISPEPSAVKEDSDKSQRKLSPSSKEKRVSFEAGDKTRKEEKSPKKDDSIDKDREDSLPPPDFEENYLIAQSDILRQASIEYDRRMQEHKEMLKKMKDEERFDENTREDFPDFETWMEEREKEESRKSSLEKSWERTPAGSNERDAAGTGPINEKSDIKPYTIGNLRDDILLEASVEGSFDSFEKHSDDGEPILEKSDTGIKQIIVKAEVEPRPIEQEEEEEEKILGEEKVTISEIVRETRAPKPIGTEQHEYEWQKEILAKIWETIMDSNLSESNESLKKLDFTSFQKNEADKKELIKQDSMKEMRRSMEKKWLERTEKILFRKDSKSEMRRRSEEKSPVTVKVTSRQRRSLSFDEEILI